MSPQNRGRLLKCRAEGTLQEINQLVAPLKDKVNSSTWRGYAPHTCRVLGADVTGLEGEPQQGVILVVQWDGVSDDPDDTVLETDVYDEVDFNDYQLGPFVAD